MSHRMYLYNQSEVGDDDCAGLSLMEWGYELPLMLQPLFAGNAFIGFNSYNDPDSEEGLYAEAPAGIEALRRFYDFIERHAARLIDDHEAFSRAKQNIFSLLDNQAVHAWFHLDAWDVFNMSDDDRHEQAQALLDEYVHTNALIREAIDSDNPTLLDDCLGRDQRWAADFRTLLNHPNYDYGWTPISSLVATSANGLEVFYDKGLQGLRDADGTIIVAARYQVIDHLDRDSGLRRVARDELIGYLDEQGNEVIPCRFEAAHPFTHDLACVRLEGKWGLIDAQGDIHLPCSFDALKPLGYDYPHWKALAGDCWGVIDSSGTWLLAPRYTDIFSEGYYHRMEDEEGALTFFSDRLHPLGGSDIEDIEVIHPDDDKCCYRLRRRDGRKRLFRVVDGQGHPLLPGEFQYAEYEHATGVWVVKRDGFGLYDHRLGDFLLPCSYSRIVVQDSIAREEDGSRPFLVLQGKRWGLYRSRPTAGWAIEPAYQHLEHAAAGVLACCQDGRWGLVDGQGNTLRPIADPLPPYCGYVPSDWIAVVFDGERAWFLDREGNTAAIDEAYAARACENGASFGMSEQQLLCLRACAGPKAQAQQAYAEGMACYQDEPLVARMHFQQAAELGHADAMNELGCLLQDIDNDLTSALHWYHQSAEGGSAVALHNLGRCYRDGLGVTADAQKAREFFRQAVAKGQTAALLELARMLIEDESQREGAFEHYMQAWKQGWKDESATDLGWLCEYRNDPAQAIRFYAHSAKNGDSYAQVRLAYLLLEGSGSRPDPQGALQWLLAAQEQGDPEAELGLAVFFLREGTEQDLEKAAHYVEVALQGEVEGAKDVQAQIKAARKGPSLLARLLGKGWNE